MLNASSLIKWAIPAALVVGSAYFFWPKGSDEKYEYTTEKVSRGSIQSLVSTSGTVKALGTVDVGSQISGQISELFVDFNSQVKQGDLLARIDSRTYDGRVKQAEAQVEIAKANIAQQEASVARAVASLGEAKRLFERQQELAKAGHVAESELDRLETAYHNAEAQVKIADAQLVLSKASLKQAQASLFQARIDLERCDIRSPVDGIVINRSIELGQTVAASLSAPVLFSIAQDLSEIQVEASVDEADIGKVAKDQPVTFYVEAFPERRYRGVIKQVRKAATEVQNVVTYTVIIGAQNRDQSLLPGMTATIEVITGEKENVLRVANTALRFKPKGYEEEENPQQARLNQRVAEISRNLKLTKEQEAAIRKILEERFAQFNNNNRRQNGNNNFGGGFNNNFRSQGDGPSGQQQNRFNEDAFREVLTEDQFREFRRLQQNNRGGWRRQNNEERPEPGAVWSLEAGGKLVRHELMLGLRGDEFTEVVSGDLQEDTKIITRSRRVE